MPLELGMRLNLSNYGALYVAGGMADQPYSLMRRMSAALNVYQAMRDFKQSKSWVDFQAHNPDQWLIVEDVLHLRQERDRYAGYRSTL